MPEVELLATGEGDYRLHDPDALRAWMRDRKRRDFVDETTAADAVRRLVGDGDNVSFGFSSFTRGPLIMIREIAEMSVKPRVVERVERLAPPGSRELDILRGEIDPGRTIVWRAAKS